MASCPFCQGDVAEDLLVFGGTCPKCFGEVPGEEAPTDPGEAVKKAQEASDRKRVKRSVFLPVVGMTMVFFGVICSAAYVWLRPEPQIAVLDFDEGEYAFEPDWDRADPEVVAVADPKVTDPKVKIPAPHVKKVDPSPKALNLGDLAKLKIDTSGDGLPEDLGTAGPEGGPTAMAPKGSQAVDATIDVKVPVAEKAPTPGLAGLDSIRFGASAQRQIKGVTLTDDNAIIDMLRKVMQAEIPKLRSCYDQRLKLRDDLQGRWALNFVVKADGTVDEAFAEPTNMQDAELEACLVGRVSKWQFEPIRADQPVKKSVYFTPSM